MGWIDGLSTRGLAQDEPYREFAVLNTKEKLIVEAYCYSDACCGYRKGGEPARTKVKRNVSRSTQICPECTHVLRWQSRRGKNNYDGI